MDLPIDYEEFLLSSNGGHNQNENSNIASLYSLAYGDTNLLEVRELVQEIENNIPQYFLIIGNTITGNLVTINLENSDLYGKIFMFRLDDLESILIFENFSDLLLNG